MQDSHNGVLVLIDIQGKLAESVRRGACMIRKIAILVQAAHILEIPILWCQQCPDKLGPTVSELLPLLTDVTPIDKSAFSCWADPTFRSRLNALGRPDVLLCGIETHVCVFQTARDLVRHGYHVEVAADAVSSRSAFDIRQGLDRIRSLGADITTVEMCLFELLGSAEHPHFRAIAKLIK